MNRFLGRILFWGMLLLAGGIGLGGNGAGQLMAAQSQRFVTIDFNDVDINLFIKYISELTRKNFIVDRAVKGKVTIISPSQISEQDAYRVFESVLEVHGFTTVPSGSIIKIVPAVQARSKSIATILKQGSETPQDRVVTQIIPLVHTNADDLKKILAPLVSKTSVLISHAQSGVLIITDVQSNIKRLLEIIKVVDVPSIGEELEIIPLEHADVTAVAKSVGQLFVRRAVKGVRNQNIRVIPYVRTNALIVFAPRSHIEKIRNLLNELDTPRPRGEGNIRVYYLQHANAEELVKVLTNLPAKQSAGSKQPAKAPAISADLKVVADVETNSLIITAAREEYLVLEDVIKKLDIPRRMVYMEALIMEVQVTKDFAIGVQWGGGGSFADETGKVFSGFSGSEAKPYNVLQGINATPPVLPAGFSLGVLKQGIEIGGVYFPDLGAVINAYKKDDDINIIATPQILTTDNKKAFIKVGENVPYITSRNTTTAQQDYTNYEYKDVATTLTITPQINQANVVRLEIGVEVIKLKNLNDGNPTTFTRNAETTVVVHNEETVVLGGIIGQDTTSGEYKVPLLGDIPLLGWLFKSKNDKETKTNLFIFITPHIVENPAEIAEIYYKKRDIMEYVQPGSSDIPDRFFHDTPDPAHAVALTDIGFAKLQRKDNRQAKDYFLQALRIDPDNPYATINLGVVYEREGNQAAAREMYQRVLEFDPGEVQGGDGEQESYEALKQLARDNILHLGSGKQP
ncbi:type II secretion system secretin GspD [Desulfogranum mediterraneum]|uniref:type II secretion system secretin GspD n=1 Tax=Desulfogranum mediterraneum TaxID=160661 RepID=UPI001377B2F3|nr:type II secretion system secretin GspD [Desulfogranum mediterraneum]